MAEAGESGALRVDCDAGAPSTPEESIAGTTTTALLLSMVRFGTTTWPVETPRDWRRPSAADGGETMAARE